VVASRLLEGDFVQWWEVTVNPFTAFTTVNHKPYFLQPNRIRRRGSLYVCEKLPTYPSPKLTLTLTSHLGQNVGLGER